MDAGIGTSCALHCHGLAGKGVQTAVSSASCTEKPFF